MVTSSILTHQSIYEATPSLAQLGSRFSSSRWSFHPKRIWESIRRFLFVNSLSWPNSPTWKVDRLTNLIQDKLCKWNTNHRHNKPNPIPNKKPPFPPNHPHELLSASFWSDFLTPRCTRPAEPSPICSKSSYLQSYTSGQRWQGDNPTNQGSLCECQFPKGHGALFWGW